MLVDSDISSSLWWGMKSSGYLTFISSLALWHSSVFLSLFLNENAILRSVFNALVCIYLLRFVAISYGRAWKRWKFINSVFCPERNNVWLNIFRWAMQIIIIRNFTEAEHRFEKPPCAAMSMNWKQISVIHLWKIHLYSKVLVILSVCNIFFVLPYSGECDIIDCIGCGR